MNDSGAWNLSAVAGPLATLGGDLHSQFVGTVRDLVGHSYQTVSSLFTQWNRNEQEFMAKIDLREREENKRQGIPEFDDPFSLPTIYTLVSSAVAAQVQLWRERHPRFPLRPRNSNTELLVRKMEALLDWQAQVTRMDKQMTYRYIADRLYGYGPRKTYWDERLQANMTLAWDPYCFFWDPAVRVDDIHSGNFIAFQSTKHLIALKRAGQYFNLKEITKRVSDGFLKDYTRGYDVATFIGNYSGRAGSLRDEYMGLDEPESLRAAGFGSSHHIIHELCWWMTPVEYFKKHGDPRDYVLPGMAPEVPVLARLTVANGQTLIGFDYLDRQSQFPGGVLATHADGMITVPLSTVGMNSGITRLCNWLASSHKEDIQLNLNGIWIYDAAKVDINNLKDRRHGLNVPVRKQAYGQNVRDALYQLDTRLVTEGHLQRIGQLMQISERATGATDPVQGATAEPSSRRTATELSIVARAAQGRFGMVSQLHDQQDGEDLVMQMYRNTQRFMSRDLQLRLTADIAALAKLNPRVDTHFSIAPGEFDDVEIEYIPFDPQQLVFKEKAADLELQLLNLAREILPPGSFDAVGWLVKIAHELGVTDFDRYISNVPGPSETGLEQQNGQAPEMTPQVPMLPESFQAPGMGAGMGGGPGIPMDSGAPTYAYSGNGNAPMVPAAL